MNNKSEQFKRIFIDILTNSIKESLKIGQSLDIEILEDQTLSYFNDYMLKKQDKTNIIANAFRSSQGKVHIVFTNDNSDYKRYVEIPLIYSKCPCQNIFAHCEHYLLHFLGQVMLFNNKFNMTQSILIDTYIAQICSDLGKHFVGTYKFKNNEIKRQAVGHEFSSIVCVIESFPEYPELKQLLLKFAKKNKINLDEMHNAITFQIPEKPPKSILKKTKNNKKVKQIKLNDKKLTNNRKLKPKNEIELKDLVQKIGFGLIEQHYDKKQQKQKSKKKNKRRQGSSPYPYAAKFKNIYDDVMNVISNNPKYENVFMVLWMTGNHMKAHNAIDNLKMNAPVSIWGDILEEFEKCDTSSKMKIDDFIPILIDVHAKMNLSEQMKVSIFKELTGYKTSAFHFDLPVLTDHIVITQLSDVKWLPDRYKVIEGKQLNTLPKTIAILDLFLYFLHISDAPIITATVGGPFASTFQSLRDPDITRQPKIIKDIDLILFGNRKVIDEFVEYFPDFCWLMRIAQANGILPQGNIVYSNENTETRFMITIGIQDEKLDLDLTLDLVLPRQLNGHVESDSLMTELGECDTLNDILKPKSIDYIKSYILSSNPDFKSDCRRRESWINALYGLIIRDNNGNLNIHFLDYVTQNNEIVCNNTFNLLQKSLSEWKSIPPDGKETFIASPDRVLRMLYLYIKKGMEMPLDIMTSRTVLDAWLNQGKQHHSALRILVKVFDIVIKNKKCPGKKERFYKICHILHKHPCLIYIKCKFNKPLQNSDLENILKGVHNPHQLFAKFIILIFSQEIEDVEDIINTYKIISRKTLNYLGSLDFDNTKFTTEARKLLTIKFGSVSMGPIKCLDGFYKFKDYFESNDTLKIFEMLEKNDTKQDFNELIDYIKYRVISMIKKVDIINLDNNEQIREFNELDKLKETASKISRVLKIIGGVSYGIANFVDKVMQ